MSEGICSSLTSQLLDIVLIKFTKNGKTLRNAFYFLKNLVVFKCHISFCFGKLNVILATHVTRWLYQRIHLFTSSKMVKMAIFLSKMGLLSPKSRFTVHNNRMYLLRKTRETRTCILGSS